MTENVDTEQNEDQTIDAPMNAKEEWLEFFKTAFIAIVLALIIRTFFLEPFNIPSGSMRPTLQIGDYLFVNKMSYGYSQYSFPFGLAPIDGRIGPGSKPQQGDVIVFKLPSDTSTDYIKRIIGMPGDTVQMREGELYINREKVKRRSMGIRHIDVDRRTVAMMEYKETLPNGVVHTIYEESNYDDLDNTPEYVVPEGHYFVMGDNRDNSQDSRVLGLVGYVPEENIVGRASFLFFSTNGYASLFEVWKWPQTVRYTRLFRSVASL